MKPITRPGAVELAGLAFVAIIWGSAFPSIKIAVGDFGASWSAALRVLIGFLVLVPILFLKREDIAAASGKWHLITLVALLNIVIPFLLISWSMKHIPAGVGSLLLGTTPFIAMVMGHFLTRDEQINRFKLLGVVFAVSGVLVLVGFEALNAVGSANLWAQLSIVAAGACYVSAGFVMRRVEMSAVAFTGTALGVGAFLLCVIAWLLAGTPNIQPSNTALMAVLWLGIFPTGLAYLLRFVLVRRVGVGTFALAMNLVPVFGIALAAILLGERIEASTVIALILVLLGLAVARISPKPVSVGSV